jgi:hypothetical protein
LLERVLPVLSGATPLTYELEADDEVFGIMPVATWRRAEVEGASTLRVMSLLKTCLL